MKIVMEATMPQLMELACMATPMPKPLPIARTLLTSPPRSEPIGSLSDTAENGTTPYFLGCPIMDARSDRAEAAESRHRPASLFSRSTLRSSFFKTISSGFPTNRALLQVARDSEKTLNSNKQPPTHATQLQFSASGCTSSVRR